MHVPVASYSAVLYAECLYSLRSRFRIVTIANHRKAFYRSANAIFGKIGRIASEEVVLQLVMSMYIRYTVWL